METRVDHLARAVSATFRRARTPVYRRSPIFTWRRMSRRGTTDRHGHGGREVPLRHARPLRRIRTNPRGVATVKAAGTYQGRAASNAIIARDESAGVRRQGRGPSARHRPGERLLAIRAQLLMVATRSTLSSAIGESLAWSRLQLQLGLTTRTRGAANLHGLLSPILSVHG
jgi:hypothetical protein